MLDRKTSSVGLPLVKMGTSEKVEENCQTRIKEMYNNKLAGQNEKGDLLS